LGMLFFMCAWHGHLLVSGDPAIVPSVSLRQGYPP